MWINVGGVRVNLNNVVAYRQDDNLNWTEFRSIDGEEFYVDCKPEQIDGFIKIMSRDGVVTVEDYERVTKIREWEPTVPAPKPSDGE